MFTDKYSTLRGGLTDDSNDIVQTLLRTRAGNSQGQSRILVGSRKRNRSREERVMHARVCIRRTLHSIRQRTPVSVVDILRVATSSNVKRRPSVTYELSLAKREELSTASKRITCLFTAAREARRRRRSTRKVSW